MPPRLRSKPYGPNSPNAAQALPDPAPRRRRATRSASAQPQEDQPGPPVREPKARKTRGKATSRGKKKATRRISSPPPPEEPQPEELEGDETASGAVAQALSAKVESPTVENGASEEHHEPHGVNVDEPPVDQMQGVQAQEPRTPSQGPSADQSVAEQNRPDLETQERPATPSVEIPVTVLPSIEPSEPELTTPILGVRESPDSFFSLRVPPASFPVRSSSIDSAASLPSDSSSSTASTAITEDSGNRRHGWLMSKLRSLYRLCTSSNDAAVVPTPAITSPAARWSLEIPMLNLDMGQSTSALGDYELISILRAVRSTGTASSRRHSHTRGSPSSSSEQSRVLRAQGATPIRRSRTPYANRSNSRRIESRGSLGRTLYRLPQLLSFGSQSELQDEVGEETNRADEHDSLNNPPETAAPDTTPPSTPERAPPATPVAPLTAPPAGTDVSPGWSRWIFNGVSRRWTVLRGRFAHDHDNRNESQQAIDTAAEPTVPTVPDSSAEAVSAANAMTSQTTRAIVPDPSITSSASPAKTNRPDISPMHSGAQRKSPLNRPTPRFISHPRVSPEPRPRRRSTSFVDTRTLLAAGEPKSANDPYAHETQREFVKRRQAARAEHERQIREAKAREEEAARYAAAAAAEEARWKRYLPPPTPAKTLTSVSRARPVTSNTATRGPIFFLQPSQTMPITASIDPASRGTASKAPVAQTAAKSNADTENQNPRKRSRGFGLDEDDLAVHEEDFTPEEWQALKAQVEKAEEDAAKAAQESLPPSKKRRVDQSSKQKKRTQQSVRRQSTGTPRQTEPPNRTPGWVPNKRGTLAQPDLSPIDSSRLSTDPESPSNSQSPQAVMQPVSPNRSKSRRETTTSSRGSSKKGMTINGVFISERQIPNCDPETQKEWRRTMEMLAKLPRFPTTAAERAAKRNKPSPILACFRSLEEKRKKAEEAEAEARAEAAKKEAAKKEAAKKEAAKKEAAKKEAAKKEAAKKKQPKRSSQKEAAKKKHGASGVPTSRAPESPETSRFSETSQLFEETYLGSPSPAASPTLPTPRRPLIKRKREPEAPDLDADPSSLPRVKRVKRNRGFEAPDPFATSSSPSSASPASSSASPASLPPRSPYDAASYFASLRPQRHSPQEVSSMTTIANVSNLQTAADEDSETGDETNDLQDASPLSRARNRAEQFKPKTPSRLRESARIPNSNASTPSALGFSSPSFLGVSLNTTPLRSDAMSIDGSSFVANPDATPVGNQAFTTESDSTNTRREDVVPLQQPASSTAVAANTTESAVHIFAEDVAWLNETLPNGNFNELQWPPRRSLVGVLDIDPETVAIVEQNGQEKGPDLAKYFETMFEAHRAAPDEFVLAL
ncbi:hypothetical protein PEBR_15321 [Penicillium brasilianum]|uniref:Uncharacterized protein n=1 Tax=Penicillium brasilianum TaxID=104259 RepID=A0A1S9RQZ5_PENBI|nr:hypothetical protein PEBR_15321 [Penicillium brasilianum]